MTRPRRRRSGLKRKHNYNHNVMVSDEPPGGSSLLLKKSSSAASVPVAPAAGFQCSITRRSACGWCAHAFPSLHRQPVVSPSHASADASADTCTRCVPRQVSQNAAPLALQTANLLFELMLALKPRRAELTGCILGSAAGRATSSDGPRAKLRFFLTFRRPLASYTARHLEHFAAELLGPGLTDEVGYQLLQSSAELLRSERELQRYRIGFFNVFFDHVANLEPLWRGPSATAATRKRALRLIREVGVVVWVVWVGFPL